MKKYEVEVLRNNVTPKQFYNYCKKRFEEKTNVNIENWIEYEDWIKPQYTEEYSINEHRNWEKPLIEVSKILPYDMQLYLQNTYNCIMEFEFYEDNKGTGYMYIVEFE